MSVGKHVLLKEYFLFCFNALSDRINTILISYKECCLHHTKNTRIYPDVSLEFEQFDVILNVK